MPNPTFTFDRLDIIKRVGKFSAVMVLGVLCGCAPQDGESHGDVKPVPQADAGPEPIEYRFDASCNAITDRPVYLLSQLPSKLVALSKLENRYELKSRNSIDLEKSIFYGIQNIQKYSDENVTYQVSDFASLIQQIVLSESIFVKGAKDISITGDGGFYARTHIEEYIFSSLDCAQMAEKYLAWINKHGPWGGSYHKAPSKIIRQGQTIYYVHSGGEFMRVYMPAIVSAIESSGG